ncbi:F-box/kelch-repeat protein At3g23880-like [Rhododendron vialii]|uniref:F-box/kelch-repeat protein At3g23880-like n=1 Tax=Rhododendron vialii TaxID=182163 RepID=UPI00265D7A05|nr:F-box/kelch-repeat protein At3g23880-like [Rhododendron vialii]
MRRKKNGRGRKRVKKKEIGAGAGMETQTKPSFPNIPEEVVIEILSRLPLKSLSRFTCVSKQWRSLVSAIFAKTSRRKMVLVQSILTSGTLMFHSIDEESRVKRVGRPWKKITSRYNPEIYGSCNGLLLLNIDDDLFLWNPVTPYFKKVLSYNPLGDRGFLRGFWALLRLFDQ